MKPRSHTLLLGLAFVGAGLAALLLAAGISHTPLTDNGDPGPRLLPAALGGLLLLGGLIESALAGIAMANRPKRGSGPSGGLKARPAEKPRARQFGVWIWMSTLLCYVATIPWLGYALSTFLLVCGLLLWQRSKWWVAVAVAGGMVGTVYLLFALAFKVSLPRGFFG